jgi:hypothetical protein
MFNILKIAKKNKKTAPKQKVETPSDQEEEKTEITKAKPKLCTPQELSFLINLDVQKIAMQHQRDL